MSGWIKRWLGRGIVRPACLGLGKVAAFGLEHFVPGNAAYPSFSRRGFHLLRKHYYLPIPTPEDFETAQERGPSELVGVDLNEAGALRLLDQVFPRYLAEF